MIIIAGAYYKYKDEILVPHYTGDYKTVDCNRYIKLDELKANYSYTYIQDNIDRFVEVDGEKYYFGEYAPYWINEKWELLSDVSNLVHEETEFNF